MSEFKLIEEIIKLSQASVWDIAKFEWKLKEIYKEYEPLTCLCGHYPINEICIIINMKNGNEAIVGNVCVNKFLNLPSDKIFKAIKRVSKDDTKALNPEAIHHIYERNWINDWERKFYLDTYQKRRLTLKQKRKREEINRIILKRVTNKFSQRNK